jgi:hypothetical protein
LDSKSTIFKNQKLPEEEVEYDDGPLVTTKLTGVESEEERWSGDLFKIFTPSKDTCHHLEEHVKLFKGMAPPAIIDFIEDDGSINMGSISTNQGDFNGNSLARYVLSHMNCMQSKTKTDIVLFLEIIYNVNSQYEFC